MDLLSNASIYSTLQNCLAPKQAMVRLAEILGVRSGDRVLDIGCGPADVLAYLPRGIDYTGFDISERYITAARRRYGEYGKFAVKPISQAAEEGVEYDTVIAICVLHHLADENAAMLFALASKALRPSGRLVTCDGAFVSGQSRTARALLWLDRGKHVRVVPAYLDIARRCFPNATARVVDDLLTIPYTYCFIEASKN